MAEVSVPASSRHRQHGALRPIRMDMTPMVDLAFLLLTFFILTTGLRRLEGMDLVAPRSGNGTPQENTITFLVGGRDTLFAYRGAFDPASTLPRRYGLDQVRQAFRAVSDTVGLRISIAPRPNARYADVLGIVDAYALAKLQRYHVVDSVPAREWRAALSGAPR